jgi:hypothetical protein
MLDVPSYCRELGLNGMTIECVISLENSFLFAERKRVWRKKNAAELY